MAISCRGCRYLSAFGTVCLLGREKSRCREKRVRDEPVTFTDRWLQDRIDSLVGTEEATQAGTGAASTRTA